MSEGDVFKAFACRLMVTTEKGCIHPHIHRNTSSPNLSNGMNTNETHKLPLTLSTTSDHHVTSDHIR